MGLDIGIISIQYLDRPRGNAYNFALEMAVEASVHGYMRGEGNNWGYFSKDEVRGLLDVFAVSQGLRQEEKVGVWGWVESLPWLPGDFIELHFNW